MNGADRVAIFTASGQNAVDFTDDRDKLTETMNRIMPRSRQMHSALDCPDLTDYLADLIQNKNDPIALSAAARETLACGGATTMQVAQSIAQSAASRVLSISEADTQIVLATMKAAVQRMSAMPGQRTIVLVSSGFLVTINYRQQETEVMDRAIRSNVTINSLDARGLSGGRQYGPISDRSSDRRW
jgi:VWFA-related protein